MSRIDDVVERSLRSFASDVFGRKGWQGKEREAVSLFAFGHLINHCRRGSVLSDARQIGIEVRVKQLDPKRAKDRCCKDLVIWPRPGATWMDPISPIAVLEWKANQSKHSTYDLRWLKLVSKKHPKFTGYTVLLDKRNRRLLVSRAKAGIIQKDWLTLP